MRIVLVEKISTSLLSLLAKYHFSQLEMQTCYLARKICSLKFQTERGRRLKLPWYFNYSFVSLIIIIALCSRIYSTRQLISMPCRHVASKSGNH